jgi:omega-hydroxy-beta-dihydromenaquinone-9 sulfotransferase
MDVRAHPLSASKSTAIWRTLHEARYAIGPRYLPRLAWMLGVAGPVSTVGAIEGALYNRRIRETPLAAPPIFILGHWRSGTTHLHNLLTQDPQFGFLTTYDAFTTNNGIIGRSVFMAVTRGSAPKKRPMDDMAVEMELPQEEEYALLNLSALSYYKAYLFPGLSDDYARHHLFFDGVSEREIDTWKRHYDFLLRKITWLSGAKRLLLKNPPNTARLKHLLDLYPDASVVYLYRDPYEVYLSTLRMHEKMSELMRLQRFDKAVASEHVLATYPRMIDRFFEDRGRVRSGRFVAIRYEDLKARPLAIIERVYEGLRLPDLDAARGRVLRYLDKVSDFRPAEYARDAATARMVEARWGATHALHDVFAREC